MPATTTTTTTTATSTATSGGGGGGGSSHATAHTAAAAVTPTAGGGSSGNGASKEDYEVLEVIGQGSFGKVCRVRRIADGKVRACVHVGMDGALVGGRGKKAKRSSAGAPASVVVLCASMDSLTHS